MGLRDFVGDSYFKWCVSQYEEARRFLKTCGRPKDWYDIYLIEQARITESTFRRYVI